MSPSECPPGRFCPDGLWASSFFTTARRRKTVAAAGRFVKGRTASRTSGLFGGAKSDRQIESFGESGYRGDAWMDEYYTKWALIASHAIDLASNSELELRLP